MHGMRVCKGDGREIALKDARESETIIEVLVDAGCDEGSYKLHVILWCIRKPNRGVFGCRCGRLLNTHKRICVGFLSRQ